MRQIQHELMVEIAVEREVMDLVYERLSQPMEVMSQLPIQVVHPLLPEFPLLRNFVQGEIKFKEIGTTYPPFAGMAFLCPADREVMRQAQARLPQKYHAAIEQVVGSDQTIWTLSCLDWLGEEVIVYHYREDRSGQRSWQLDPGHRCPFGTCT